MPRTPGRAADTSHREVLPADITAVHVSVLPARGQRWAASFAGARDGRRGVNPDPESGLTPYVQALAADNATAIGSERLRTQAQLAPLQQDRAAWVERREEAAAALAALDDEEAGDGDADHVAQTRRRRAHDARRRQLRDQVAAATEHISVLDEQYADRVSAGALRIQRYTQRAQHLVARYWRAYSRHHPEFPELRQGYTVPAVPVPAHPLDL